MMTALGIALTVAVLLAILALVNGLNSSLHSTGNPLHVLVLRKGSDHGIGEQLYAREFPSLER